MRAISLIILVTLTSCLQREEHYEQVRVRGYSMYPTLKHLELIKIDRHYYDTEVVRVDDIVVAQVGKSKHIVKRVRALSGDIFYTEKVGEGCILFINKEPIQNSIKKNNMFNSKECKMFSLYEKDYKRKIPRGAILLLGDNIAESFDASSFGLLSVKSIMGKVLI